MHEDAWLVPAPLLAVLRGSAEIRETEVLSRRKLGAPTAIAFALPTWQLPPVCAGLGFPMELFATFSIFSSFRSSRYTYKSSVLTSWAGGRSSLFLTSSSHTPTARL